MKERKNSIMLTIGMLFLAVLCLFVLSLGSNQAILSTPLPRTFEGEYRLGEGDWQPLTEDAPLSALDGDLILRGHFTEEIPEEARLNFYLNHIGFSFFVNGEWLMEDAAAHFIQEGQPLPPDLCCKQWDDILLPEITPQDEVEIHLYNAHSFGNGSAYRDFLDTLQTGPNNLQFLYENLKQYTQPFLLLGLGIFLTALVLLGISIGALFLRVSSGGQLLPFGLMALFAGGFLIFDALNFSPTEGSILLKTYGYHFCMMFTVYFFGINMQGLLEGKPRRLAERGMQVSAVFNLGILLLCLLKVKIIYDTLQAWVIFQLFLTLLLLFCCLWQAYQGKKKDIFLLAGSLMLLALLLDFMGVGRRLYSTGTCTKLVFIPFFLYYCVWMIKKAIHDYMAAEHAKALEKELENSRIAIMLSQIRPHFIYNTLGTIRQLCLNEPKKAAELVQDFAFYLRGNFSELDSRAPIPLSRELEHVRYYVHIEQVRFPDIQVVFDIRTEDFLLPALSIQPLVENAIKHGLQQEEGGGTVTVTAYETETAYCVLVEDDGVGFTQADLEDGKKHIGLGNIRQRVKNMCGGDLVVESVPHEGTKALLTIPKEEER